jgi:hypothetical protein
MLDRVRMRLHPFLIPYIAAVVTAIFFAEVVF